MNIDSFALYCILPNLQEALRDRTVRDVAQPSPETVLIRFRRRPEEERAPVLLLSAHPVHSRVLLVETFPRQRSRSHLAEVLFTHLYRSRLVEVEQVGIDRILRLRFEPPPGVLAEDRGDRLLIAELMGKHGNIVLVNAKTERILEAVKHVDASQNRYREVLPGMQYVPPPQRSERLDPFRVSRDEFLARIDPERPPEVWRQLLEAIDGLSPTVAREIVAAAPSERAEDLWEAFSRFIRCVRAREVEPVVYFQGVGIHERPKGYALFPPRTVPYTRLERFDSVLEAMDRYHQAVAQHEWVERIRREIERTLTRREEAVFRRLEALRADRDQAERAETFKKYGELLMAALHQLSERIDVARVPDYYQPDAPEIEIPLDPARSPLENAQEYFRKYRKYRRGAARIAERIADAEQELSWIAEYRQQLAAAEDVTALDRLQEALRRQGWLREPQRARRDRREGPFRVFTVGDWRILVGRNDAENDLLVTRVARKDDVWLHAKEIPGSHVLIRNPERKSTVPMDVLEKAARLAAYFSKGRTAARVPVDYTQARYVVRPKGTRPGFVTYTRERTLLVTPELPAEFRSSS